MYEKLFTPVKIGSLTVKNRFAMAPMGPLGLSDSEGGFNQRGIDYYVERAKGEAEYAELPQFHLQSGALYPHGTGDDGAGTRLRQ